MALDGYIRVSSTRGRGGDSFISPDMQRERINAWAVSKGVEIQAWHEDFDQSGGKTIRPGLDEAMRRCQTGASDGIVVAKIDRFARTLIGALELIRELEDTGAEFVSVAEGIDSTTPAGKMMQRLMLVLAEFELDRIRESWSDARRNAVERGIHISSAVPVGYVRGEDRLLRIDPITGPHIQRAFDMAADGTHWRKIGEYLTAHNVPGPYGRVNWIVVNVKNVITNPVYKGEARSGEFINRDAHEALVTDSVWEQANRQRIPTPARSLKPALLAGLIRCAGCQHIMRPDSMRRTSGPSAGLRMRTYRCRKEYANGVCPAPAVVSGWTIEPWVLAQVDARLAGIDFANVGIDAVEHVADLEAQLEDAIHELALFRDARIESALGVEAFAEGLTIRAGRVDDLRVEIAQARGMSGSTAALFLSDAFQDMTVDEKRTVLTNVVDAVMVRKGKLPLDERAIVLWTGQLPDSVPRRGKRRPLQSFHWPDSPS